MRLALTFAVCATGCRGYSASPAAIEHARTGGDQIAAALSVRLTGVVRTPRYDYDRHHVDAALLVPSHEWNDTVWTSTAADSRTLTLTGDAMSPGHYRLDARDVDGLPMSLGEMRRTSTLVHVGGNVYEWTGSMDQEIGAATPDDIGRILALSLGAAEHHNARSLRDDRAAMFPRTAAQLGQFVSIDSITTAAPAEGAVTTTLALTVDPSRLANAYPHYAKYLGKYAGPVIAQLTIADSSGTPWILASYIKGHLVMHWRSIDGRLVPLTGTMRALPSHLRATVDVSSKFGMLTVGVKHLVMDLALTTTARERSFTLVAHQPPDWELPLAAERLLRTPLDRPFAGAGSSYTFGVRDTTHHAFLFSRSHITVEESAILRLLSHLSRGAVTDFDSSVASEEEAYWSGVCNALRADLRGG